MKRLLFLISAFFLAACCVTGQETSPNDADNEADKTNRSEPNSKDGQLYWIFLTTGKSSKGVEPQTIQEMQTAHLANFKTLAEKGQLLTAGPMDDPAKNLRGIVVVRAENRDQLMSYFKDDPYVQNGYLKVEATLMQFEHGVINTRIAPQGLEEFRIVILEKNGKEHQQTDEDSKKNRKYIADMSTNDELLMTAFLPKSENARQAILIMAKPEKDETIVETINQIPAVKSGAWKSNVIKLYMGKGTLSSS